MIAVLANDDRGCWIEFVGTEALARKKYKMVKVLPNLHQFGPMTLRAQERPFDYNRLNFEEQWRIDKELGILDWNGEPSK